MHRWVVGAIAAAGCGSPPTQVVGVERQTHVVMIGEPGPPELTDEGPPPELSAPALRVRLGHYSNHRRGVGLIIDLTRTPARVRFDGTAATITLDVQRAGNGTIELIRRVGDTVLRIERDGTPYVILDGTSEPIPVRRDGDAEPL